MVRVGVLGEDDELAGIVSPVAQEMEVERAPKHLRRRGRLSTHARASPCRTHRPSMLPSIARGLSPGQDRTRGGAGNRPQKGAGLIGEGARAR